MIGEILETVAQVGILGFVVSSMLATGTGLTLAQIVDPLRNGRLLIAVLVANFLAVPVLAFVLTRILPMDAPTATTIVLLGTMAGAPFLPKLAQAAHGDVAFSVGLMVLLMVVTIFSAPLVVPLLLPGAAVAAWDIARPLLFLMLLPLALALLCRERYPDLAAGWSPELARISSTSLTIALVAAVLIAYDEILGAIGSQIFIATLILAAGSVVIGWGLAAGGGAATQSVAGLGTAQRNLAAAQLVAGTSFGGDTLVLTIAASLFLTILLIVAAGEIGKRGGRAASAAASPVAD